MHGEQHFIARSKTYLGDKMLDTRLHDAIQQQDINAIRTLAQEFKLRFSITNNPTWKTLLRSADRAIINIIRKG